MSDILTRLQDAYQRGDIAPYSLMAELVDAVGKTMIELPNEDGTLLYTIDKRRPCYEDDEICLYPENDSCTECSITNGVKKVREYKSTFHKRITKEIDQFKQAYGKTVFLTEQAAKDALERGKE